MITIRSLLCIALCSTIMPLAASHSSHESYGESSIHIGSNNGEWQEKEYRTPSSPKSSPAPTPEELEMRDILSLKFNRDINSHNYPILIQLSSDNFSALAHRVATQIAQEKIRPAKESTNKNNSSANKNQIAKGVKALAKHVSYLEDTAQKKLAKNATPGEKKAHTKQQMVLKEKARIRLIIAQHHLPASFHWNILPTTQKVGVVATALFACAGVCQIVEWIFASKQKPQYDPSLVAAVNQQDHTQQ